MKSPHARKKSTHELVDDSRLEQSTAIGQWVMSNDPRLSNDWHLTLFGTLLSDWSTNQGVVIMWSDTATGHGIHKQKDGQKWRDGCQKNAKEKLQPRVTGGTTYIVCSRLCGTAQLVLDGKFQNNPGPIYQYKTRSSCNSAIHNIPHTEKYENCLASRARFPKFDPGEGLLQRATW